MSTNYVFGLIFYFSCITYEALFISELNSSLFESRISKESSAALLNNYDLIQRNQFIFVVSIGFVSGDPARFNPQLLGNMISKKHALTFITPTTLKA